MKKTLTGKESKLIYAFSLVSFRAMGIKIKLYLDLLEDNAKIEDLIYLFDGVLRDESSKSALRMLARRLQDFETAKKSLLEHVHKLGRSPLTFEHENMKKFYDDETKSGSDDGTAYISFKLVEKLAQKEVISNPHKYPENVTQLSEYSKFEAVSNLLKNQIVDRNKIIQECPTIEECNLREGDNVIVVEETHNWGPVSFGDFGKITEEVDDYTARICLPKHSFWVISANAKIICKQNIDKVFKDVCQNDIELYKTLTVDKNTDGVLPPKYVEFLELNLKEIQNKIMR